MKGLFGMEQMLGQEVFVDVEGNDEVTTYNGILKEYGDSYNYVYLVKCELNFNEAIRSFIEIMRDPNADKKYEKMLESYRKSNKWDELVLFNISRMYRITE